MKKILFLMAALSLVFTVSCSSDGSKKEPIKNVVQQELEGAPEWVINGGAGQKDKICGVGSSAGSRNVALMRTAAMGRGRTSIARSLQVSVKSMLKDYQATTTGGEEFGTAANDEQHVEDVSKQITDMTLSGTQQENTWVAKTGTYYVLVCLDVDKFKDSVSKMGQLAEGVRAAVKERADKAFNELDKATSK